MTDMTKALRKLSQRVKQVSETQDANAVEAGQKLDRIERVLGTTPGSNLTSLGTYIQESWDMLKAVRADVGTIRSSVAIIEDGLKGVRSDLVDVAAEMADDLGQRIDAQGFEMRKQLADRMAKAEYDAESRYQSILAYLKVLESKIDKVDHLVHETVDLGGS